VILITFRLNIPNKYFIPIGIYISSSQRDEIILETERKNKRKCRRHDIKTTHFIDNKQLRGKKNINKF